MARFLICFFCLAVAVGPSAAADDYPCGPAGMPLFMKRLIPQGAFGADFRPACRQHDWCYQSGLSRKACDRAFRQQMHCACAGSRHPFLCRMVANHQYRMTRLFGGPAFGRAW